MKLSAGCTPCSAGLQPSHALPSVSQPQVSTISVGPKSLVLCSASGLSHNCTSTYTKILNGLRRARLHNLDFDMVKEDKVEYVLELSVQTFIQSVGESRLHVSAPQGQAPVVAGNAPPTCTAKEPVRCQV